MAKFKINPALLSLVGPFTKIARAISRNHQVTVIPSGTECSTDGHKTIYIPFNADKLTPEAQQKLNGMLDHEVSHVSEEKVHQELGLRTPIEIMKRETDPTVKMFFNVYEDIRIESKYEKLYPGMAANLRVLNEDTVNLFTARHGSGGNAWHELGCAIICEGRGFSSAWLNPGLVPYLGMVRHLIARCPAMTCGEDALNLARETYDILKEFATETVVKSKSKKHEGEEGDEGSESPAGGVEEDEGEEGSEGEESGGSAGADEGGERKSEHAKGDIHKEDEDAEEGDSDSKDGEGHSEESKGSEGSEEAEEDSGDKDSGPTDDDDDADEAAAEGLETAKSLLDAGASMTDLLDSTKAELKKRVEHEAEVGRHYIPDPASVAMDKMQEIPRELINERVYRNAKEEVSREIAALRQRQTAVLQIQTKAKPRSALRAGRLDSRALTRARMGSDQVFRDVRKAELLDTAIEVLVDCSGSMGRNTNPKSAAYYAMRTAIALCESWEAVGRGLKTECIGFTNLGLPPRSSGPHFITRTPLVYMKFKGYDETMKKVGHRFSAIQGYGDNSDGEAVMYAARRLAARPEKRKILMVISDGYPACYGMDGKTGSAYLKEVVKVISGSGIEVIGFGAGTDAPKQFYNKATGARHIVVTDFSKLAVECMKVFKELLTEQRKVAA